MKVAYLGPLRDYSGYGEAARHAILALDAAGVDVIGQLVRYQSESADLNSIAGKVTELLSRQGDYKIKILHTTPDEYPRFIDQGKFHVGHFFWETDRVPKVYADNLNLMDEIWTGSKANLEAMKKSGVTVPIHVFPQAIETERPESNPYEIAGFDGYLFYSIFEWTDRKNPEALLKAYYQAFQGGENVGLVIKTYFANFTNQNKRIIRGHIAKLKNLLGLEVYPPVFLYLDLMERDEVWRLHQTGKAFVSTHRGEGWGIPQVEAALAGNPIISTDFGGAHEYFSNRENAMLVKNKLVPLKGMQHASHIYDGDQNWADVDVDTVSACMKWCFENQSEAERIGQAGKKLATDRFSFKRVGKEMADRLKVIEGQL